MKSAAIIILAILANLPTTATAENTTPPSSKDHGFPWMFPDRAMPVDQVEIPDPTGIIWCRPSVCKKL